MKITQFSILLICMILMDFYLTGCISPPAPKLPSTPSQTHLLSPSPSSTKTQEPVQIPKLTLTPKFESTDTPTVPISVISPTLTSTLLPTLTAQERERVVRKMIETNEGCELPCWWGIIPGKTSWLVASALLHDLGVSIGSKPTENGTVFHGTGGFDFEGINLYNRFGFEERDGMVESIYIMGDGSANPIDFQSVWKRFSPQLVINTNGRPSRVWIRSTSIHIGDTGMVGYTLWLFYDHLGFVIKYEGGVEYASVYHICPRFNNGEDIDQIKMLLQSPKNTLPLERMDDLTTFYRKYIRTIEEASGIDEEGFYQLFLQDDKPACFDVSSNVFP